MINPIADRIAQIIIQHRQGIWLAGMIERFQFPPEKGLPKQRIAKPG
jgi:hypothetical protein